MGRWRNRSRNTILPYDKNYGMYRLVYTNIHFYNFYPQVYPQKYILCQNTSYFFLINPSLRQRPQGVDVADWSVNFTRGKTTGCINSSARKCPRHASGSLLSPASLIKNNKKPLLKEVFCFKRNFLIV